MFSHRVMYAHIHAEIPNYHIWLINVL